MIYRVDITYFTDKGTVGSGFTTLDGWMVKQAFEEYMDKIRQHEQHPGNVFHIEVDEG